MPWYNGNYCPSNCAWRTKREQMLNRSDNRHLTANGVTLTMTEWAERLGITAGTVWSRIARGWPVEEAVTLPGGSRCYMAVRNPELVQQGLAHKAVAYALKIGKLVKPAHCEFPGCEAPKVQAHHHVGYERKHRLVVKWLCCKHHYAADVTLHGKKSRRRLALK